MDASSRRAAFMNPTRVLCRSLSRHNVKQDNCRYCKGGNYRIHKKKMSGNYRYNEVYQSSDFSEGMAQINPFLSLLL